MQKKGKLELTWVGKYDEEKPVEPRILLEDPEKSYGDPDSENMLIHGDNLIALQALQQDYAGKIKCIYIDPPFNTGQAFENYDDNLEMSIWLNLMRKRLQLLHSLLRDDGTLFVHINDSYLPYLTILLDEIFGRSNRSWTRRHSRSRMPEIPWRACCSIPSANFPTMTPTSSSTLWNSTLPRYPATRRKRRKSSAAMPD